MSKKGLCHGCSIFTLLFNMHHGICQHFMRLLMISLCGVSALSFFTTPSSPWALDVNRTKVEVRAIGRAPHRDFVTSTGACVQH